MTKNNLTRKEAYKLWSRVSGTWLPCDPEARRIAEEGLRAAFEAGWNFHHSQSTKQKG